MDMHGRVQFKFTSSEYDGPFPCWIYTITRHQFFREHWRELLGVSVDETEKHWWFVFTDKDLIKNVYDSLMLNFGFPSQNIPIMDRLIVVTEAI